MEELSEFELLGGEPVQESLIEISIFKIAIRIIVMCGVHWAGAKIFLEGQKSRSRAKIQQNSDNKRQQQF